MIDSNSWNACRRFGLAFCLMFPAVMAGGCATSVPLAPPPPDVRVTNMWVAFASTERADLAMELQIRNVSEKPVSFSGLTYFLSSEGNMFGTGKQPWQNTAPARVSQPITVHVPVFYERLFDLVPNARRGTIMPLQARLELLAPAETGGTTIVTAEGRGELPLPAAPAVHLEELQWLRLDDDRAEARLHITVQNTNHFPVELTGLSCRVWLAGRTVSSVQLKDMASGHLPENAEKSLEATISFVPNKVRLPANQLARGRPGSYRLDGTCEMRTALGHLTLPFDESGTAPFQAE
jgi:LEA14-like dessication related protein